jgi:hypothetical protein
MRELNIGTKKFTKVLVVDEPGAGNACHEYAISKVDNHKSDCATHNMPAYPNENCNCGADNIPAGEYGYIRFQNGPIKENGVNGCQNEDLLAIVIDRLEGFQSGELACEENQCALEHIRSALKCLNARTKDRQARGVEGTSQ